MIGFGTILGIWCDFFLSSLLTMFNDAPVPGVFKGQARDQTEGARVRNIHGSWAPLFVVGHFGNLAIRVNQPRSPSAVLFWVLPVILLVHAVEDLLHLFAVGLQKRTSLQ